MEEWTELKCKRCLSQSFLMYIRNLVYINALKFVNDRVMLVISFWSNCSVSLTKMETGALTSRSS